jgi:hypothetical protein
MKVNTELNYMFKNKILKEEVEEEKAFNDFARMVAEEYNLKMEIAIAVSRKNLKQAVEFEKEIEPIIIKRIQLEEAYLRSKLKSAIASKNFIIKSNNNTDLDTLRKIILPIFDKDIWEAEDALDHHLKKYGKK